MFDLDALQAAIAAHGPVARVVIAGHEGSSPREAGAAMLVWAEGQSGSIGGGALEWEAARRARAMLAADDGGRDGEAGHLPPPSWGRDGEGGAGAGHEGGSLPDAAAPHPHPLPTRGRGGALPLVRARVDRVPLGPALGQCCGGAVVLVTEVFSAVPQAVAGVVARSLDGRAMPLAVARMLDRARGRGEVPGVMLMQAWLAEPVAVPAREVWVWGAGHVGRAVVAVLAPLPGVAVTWVDVAADRFPGEVPDGVTVLPAAEPARLVAHAPVGAEHLILTYSHALDLELCHRLLGHGFASAGLIGSATKWARFRGRLVALGHAPAAVVRITCPMGDPTLGKHPQAIAVGVAAAFLRAGRSEAARQEVAG
ncbi:MAG: xanthine dehydrogenase accessory protein XdhC [Gemmobacter sp.]